MYRDINQEEVTFPAGPALLSRDPRAVALSLAEAAERLGFTSQTISRLVRDGHLRAKRVGGKLRIIEADLAEYLAAAKDAKA
jgi:excisionase family DNA binding protein